jgi:hypothetical protein
MIPAKITYEKLSSMIETVDPMHNESGFQVKNLLFLIALDQELTHAQRQELQMRLYFLDRTIKARITLARNH